MDAACIFKQNWVFTETPILEKIKQMCLCLLEKERSGMLQQNI